MIIKEFLPNPAGKDTAGEYLILLNDGTEPVDLTGWQIKDLSGKIFSLQGYTLAPGQELKLSYRTTRIALNNNGETVYLFDSTGKAIDELSHSGTAGEGVIVSRMLEANQEVRQELLESLPEVTLQTASLIAPEQLLFFMALTAAILSGLAAWILNKFPRANSESFAHERIK